jgi:radical SAM protein with 4Fe4S-binding SPASM domain
MQALNQLINKIKNCGGDISIGDANIRVTLDLEKIDFLRMKPYLYLLLNKFERSYFIIIQGLPYCLMTDAENHIIYNKKPDQIYLKDKNCAGCKYESACPGWPKNAKKTIEFHPSPIEDLPKEIVLEITQNCNLNCPVCFSQRSKKELSLAKIKKIIDECVRLRIKTIRFTGGEPLLYKDIEAALTYAKERNLYIILNTNATILNKKIKLILKNYVNNILVSLQGFSPASERKLTRYNYNFKAKLKNIIELKYLIPKVRLGTAISQTLLDNLSKYHNLIKKLNIKDWALFRPMRGVEEKEFKISSEDLIGLMRSIKEIKKDNNINLKIGNAVPFCIAGDFKLAEFTLSGSESDDGHSRLILDAEGFLKPSYFIKENLGSDIKRAWLSPLLTKMRWLGYLPKKCKNCLYLKWCKGGSRYWAKIAYGDYFKPDPLMDIII